MSGLLPTATQGPVVLRDPLEHVYSLVTEHGDVHGDGPHGRRSARNLPGYA